MSDRSDVEALIADAKRSVDTLRNASFFEIPRGELANGIEGLIRALELLLSPTPTGDERELHKVIHEAVTYWEDFGGNIKRILEERLAGFRFAPKPVYEYAVRHIHTGKIDTQFSEDSCRRYATGFDMVGTDQLFPRELLRRAVSSWELVPVVSTSKEQGDE